MKTQKALFLELVEGKLRREAVEKLLTEAKDTTQSRTARLQRAQRDRTDFGGRLRYGGQGLNPIDIRDLEEKERTAIAAIAENEQAIDLATRMGASLADELRTLQQCAESCMNKLHARYSVSSLARNNSGAMSKKGATEGTPRGGPDREDGGGSAQPTAASFAEIITRIVDELQHVAASTSTNYLKLFVQDMVPAGDAAPHFSTWEQRTVTALQTTKEKVQRSQQALVDAVNLAASYVPELAKDVGLWTEFVSSVDAAFLHVLGDVIDRALYFYERSLGGKSPLELFSVNLKLTPTSRVAIVPTPTDLPNLIAGLLEDKMMSILPSNLISDLVTVATEMKSGKGVPHKTITTRRSIVDKLSEIKQHTARYGEELVSLVVQLEDRFQHLWNSKTCSSMSLPDLLAAKDLVETQFGSLRIRVFHGAFQLNAFQLYDTILSLLFTQIDIKRQMLVPTDDDEAALRALIHPVQFESITRSRVPSDGVASILQAHVSKSSPTKGDVSTHVGVSGRSGGGAKAGNDWSDGFDPVRYVEQLVLAQVQTEVTEVRLQQQRKALPTPAATVAAAAPTPSAMSPHSVKSKQVLEPLRSSSDALSSIQPSPKKRPSQEVVEQENIPISSNSTKASAATSKKDLSQQSSSPSARYDVPPPPQHATPKGSLSSPYSPAAPSAAGSNNKNPSPPTQITASSSSSSNNNNNVMPSLKGALPLQTNSVTSSVQSTTSPRPSSTPSHAMRQSLVGSLKPTSMTPNRGKVGNSPTSNEGGMMGSHAPAPLVYPSSIRSAEVPSANTRASLDRGDLGAPPVTRNSTGAWGSPEKELPSAAYKQQFNSGYSEGRAKPRTILDVDATKSELPQAPPPGARTGILSPYREKTATSSTDAYAALKQQSEQQKKVMNIVEKQLQFTEDKTEMAAAPSNAPKGILKGSEGASQPYGSSTAASVEDPHDDDEYMLQKLLEKERESLERIRLMKEKDEQRRREIQAAHRRTTVNDEVMKKVSPRSEYQQLLEEQARLDAARRENELKLIEAEKEARRVREEQNALRQRETEDEERKQREWEEQLRRQHDENAARRQREKQAAEAAEREAMQRQLAEDEWRQKSQRQLEERLEEELRRRAMQQQREREERDAERLRLEHEALLAQEAERQRQRAALERMRSSPPPIRHEQEHRAGSPVIEDPLDSSALRRKLALPPVQASSTATMSEARPATPPSVPVPARGRKLSGSLNSTPRGATPLATPSTTTAQYAQPVNQRATPVLNSADLSPTESGKQQPQYGSDGALTPRENTPLAERSLLDEYKQYCLNLGIKPNSGLLKSLPSVVGDYATTINLDLNYIGVKGVQPLLQILKRNRGLRLLNLKDNNLENNEVRALVNVLLTESGNSLTHLDLSNNPISLAGGSALMDLVSQKRQLTTIVLRGTLIQPKVVEKIVEAAESNRRRAAWNNGS